jgi:hypothetical protein
MLAFSSQDPIAHEAALHLWSERHHQILAEKPVGWFINATLEQAIADFFRALVRGVLGHNLASFDRSESSILLVFPYTRVLVPVIPLKCAESIKTR